MFAITNDERLRELVGVFLEDRMPDVFHIAGQRFHPIAAGVRQIDLRIFFMQPGRRRPRRDVEHDPDAGRREQVHHLVEPFKGIFSLGRFKAIPAQVAEPNHIKRGLLHQVDIALPPFPRPVVRVVIRACIQQPSITAI
ncbi:hypothetical protein OMP40_05185 [Cohnella rhizosphaerae]|uniref:Uncharacterized protein n=1 Tax=Cohnella rhizosphaerae TaxID=1457232 RepID=A0A9X4KQA3_9BACL|nr:hypothetical protein [Cohnella rhizosphaerae]MDG0808850.1 hypothetical protein [Cohnella rhizosphaerae]